MAALRFFSQLFFEKFENRKFRFFEKNSKLFEKNLKICFSKNVFDKKHIFLDEIFSGQTFRQTTRIPDACGGRTVNSDLGDPGTPLDRRRVQPIL